MNRLRIKFAIYFNIWFTFVAFFVSFFFYTLALLHTSLEIWMKWRELMKKACLNVFNIRLWSKIDAFQLKWILWFLFFGKQNHTIFFSFFNFFFFIRSLSLSFFICQPWLHSDNIRCVGGEQFHCFKKKNKKCGAYRGHSKYLIVYKQLFHNIDECRKKKYKSKEDYISNCIRFTMTSVIWMVLDFTKTKCAKIYQIDNSR